MLPTRLSFRSLSLLATCLLAVSLPDPARAANGGPSARELYDQGRAALATGDEPTALQAFREAADHVPSWVHPRLELAELAVKRREGAAEARRALLQLAPENLGLLRLHRLLGELADLEGDDQAAVVSFTKAIELSPWSSGSFYEKRAVALSRLGRHREAAEDFREALRRQPDELHLRARLADALEEAGQKDEARAELEYLVRLQPDRESPVRRLARFLERSGDVAGARAMHARADKLRAAPPKPTRNLRPLLPSRR